MVHNRNNALSFDDIQHETASLPTDQLTVHLLTPTRITHEGQITDKLPFHLFWRRLIGRISALGYFHCGESLDLDFKGLIAQAETVQTVQSRLRWHDWTRYSSRQNQKMQLGGLVGGCDVCRRSGGVPAICSVGRVSPRRQKRNIWVGKISGWIKPTNRLNLRRLKRWKSLSQISVLKSDTDVPTPLMELFQKVHLKKIRRGIPSLRTSGRSLPTDLCGQGSFLSGWNCRRKNARCCRAALQETTKTDVFARCC